MRPHRGRAAMHGRRRGDAGRRPRAAPRQACHSYRLVLGQGRALRRGRDRARGRRRDQGRVARQRGRAARHGPRHGRARAQGLVRGHGEGAHGAAGRLGGRRRAHPADETRRRRRSPRRRGPHPPRRRQTNYWALAKEIYGTLARVAVGNLEAKLLRDALAIDGLVLVLALLDMSSRCFPRFSSQLKARSADGSSGTCGTARRGARSSSQPTRRWRLSSSGCSDRCCSSTRS